MRTKKRKIMQRVLVVCLMLSIMVGLFPNMNFIPNVLADTATDVWDGSIATSFGGGNGTESDPYLINTAAQLAYLAQQTNAGNAFSNQYFELTTNLNFNSIEWTPIGNYASNFSGTFEGGDFIIENMSINTANEDAGLFPVGLFGYISNGAITNIGLDNTKIVVSSPITAGGIAGMIKSSVINNCHNSGLISVSSTTGLVKLDTATVGGIVGHMDSSSVTNCYNTGKISALSEQNSAHAGGIVAYAYPTPTGSVISNCYNTGEINAISSFSTDSVCAGGIIGNGSINIYNCYNVGRVNVSGGVSSKYIHTGGIAGYVFSSCVINDCYFDIEKGNQTKGVDLSKYAVNTTINTMGLTTNQMKDKSSYRNYDDAVSLYKTKYLTEIYMEYAKMDFKYLGNKVSRDKRDTLFETFFTLAELVNLDKVTGFIDPAKLDIAPFIAKEVLSGSVKIGDILSDSDDRDLIEMNGKIQSITEGFYVSLYPMYNANALSNVDLLADRNIALKLTSEWASNDVNRALLLGITPQENKQNDYKASISRAEAADLFVSTSEAIKKTSADAILYGINVIPENIFNDVNNNRVSQAVALNIVTGIGNGNFNPDGTLTREQAAVIVANTAKMLGADTSGFTHNFSDVTSSWSASAIGFCRKNGLMSGVGNNKFNPSGTFTYEQAITVAVKLYDMMEN